MCCNQDCIFHHALSLSSARLNRVCHMRASNSKTSHLCIRKCFFHHLCNGKIEHQVSCKPKSDGGIFFSLGHDQLNWVTGVKAPWRVSKGHQTESQPFFDNLQELLHFCVLAVLAHKLCLRSGKTRRKKPMLTTKGQGTIQSCYVNYVHVKMVVQMVLSAAWRELSGG